MAKRELLGTVNQVYQDLTLYLSRSQSGLPIKADMVVQSETDVAFAKKLVGYLKEGSFLPKGRIAENARTILQVFKAGHSGQDVSNLTDLTLRQVYPASDLVEEMLNLAFPSGLRNLWSTRQFDVILQFMSVDTSKVSDVLFYLNEDSETLNYADKLYNLRNSVSIPEVKKRLPLLDKEFVDSCVRAKETLDSVRALIGTAQVDLYNLFTLVKLLENGIALPIEVYSDLVFNDRFGIFNGQVNLEEDI